MKYVYCLFIFLLYFSKVKTNLPNKNLSHQHQAISSSFLSPHFHLHLRSTSGHHTPSNLLRSSPLVSFAQVLWSSTKGLSSGLSSAPLEIADAENGATGIFSGNLSLDVTEGTKWNISRGGFCGMRSKKFDGFIDLDPFDTIVIKLKGDGRCYISTIYTENWVNSLGEEEDNSWQAFVFVPKDNWYITKIPLAQYLPTWRGNVIDARLEMNPSRVVGMSLSVNAEGGVPSAKSGPRDFRVDLDWIKALRSQ